MKAFGLIQRVLGLTIFLLLCMCIVGVCSGEEVIPEMPKGTSMGSWHPSAMCDQCHATLIPKDQVPAILGSCKCHRDEFTSGGKIDVVFIEEVHGIKTCTRCHIGSWDEEETLTYDTIHTVHAQIHCNLCHGDLENIDTPESKNCDFCHKGGVHFVHSNKTEDLCLTCHGTAGKKYLEEDVSVEDIFLMSNNTTASVAQDYRPKYPTILNILKSLIDLIFG